MNRHNLQRMLRREWPYIVIAARGTIAAVAALAVAVLLKLECPYPLPVLQGREAVTESRLVTGLSTP